MTESVSPVDNADLAPFSGCSDCDEPWELHDDMSWCMNPLNTRNPANHTAKDATHA